MPAYDLPGNLRRDAAASPADDAVGLLRADPPLSRPRQQDDRVWFENANLLTQGIRAAAFAHSTSGISSFPMDGTHSFITAVNLPVHVRVL